jgi:hypothetical protein
MTLGVFWRTIDGQWKFENVTKGTHRKIAAISKYHIERLQ